MIQVLIVEDDVRIAEINRMFTEKVDGYQVIGIATDEQQAKKLLEILTPNLVLLDIYFPDMNGLDLLRYIKLHYPQTDVITITASKDFKSVREAIHGGVYDFIIKPIVFDRLKETLEKYKQFHLKMTSMENTSNLMNQEKVDDLIRERSEKRQKEMYYPKGIDKLTLDKISTFITQTDDNMTAEEVSNQLGISRSTARRYLEYLVSNSIVTADVFYGTVGRPERVYRVSIH